MDSDFWIFFVIVCVVWFLFYLKRENDKFFQNLDSPSGNTFAESGATIWSGPPILMKFSYRAYGKKVQTRTVRVTRCFTTLGHNYLTGYCLLRKAERCFRFDRIFQDIYLPNKGGVIHKGLLLQLLKRNGKLKEVNIPVRSVPKFFDVSASWKLNEVCDSVCPKKKIFTENYNSGSYPACPSAMEVVSKKNSGRISQKGWGRSPNVSTKMGSVNWKEEGILSAFGYRVGKSNGVEESVRHRILNEILMCNDLSSFESEINSGEWGAPRSEKRFAKLVSTLQLRINIAKGRQRSGHVDFHQAIREWKRDLDFLRKGA